MRLVYGIDRSAFALALLAIFACQTNGCTSQSTSSEVYTPPLAPVPIGQDVRGGDGSVALTIAVGATDGEFTVGQSGDASYSIALKVLGGTAGIQPDARLVYESTGGDSPLGVGWSLGGQSAITRCPTTIETEGYIDGVDFDANDRFCLDGQRLVAIEGTYGADATEYRTELESFTRIVSIGTAPGGGPLRFVAESKDGQIREFGGTEDSRVEMYRANEPDLATPVTNWAINRVEDRSGNYMTYTYTKRTASSVDAIVGIEHYLSRIDYTGNAGASLAPYASVRMEYETRPDPLEGYAAGALTLWKVRLKRIANYTGEQVVRSLKLTYEQSVAAGRSQLASVQECGSDESCFPATTFGNSRTNLGFSVQAPVLSAFDPNSHKLRSIGQRHETFADVDGDGDLDRAWIPDGETNIFVMLWGGDSFGPATLWLSGPAAPSGGAIPTFSLGGSHEAWLDMNGDGKTDRVWIPAGLSDVYVARSTGTSFGTPEVWLRDQPAGIRSMSQDGLHEAFTDVDGNGLPDFVWIPQGGADGQTPVYAALSNGTGFAAPKIVFATRPFANTSDEGRFEDYLDLNGDGLVDYAWIPRGDSVTFATLATADSANGVQYENPTVWATEDSRPPKDSGGKDNFRTFEDVTGDRLPDLVFYRLNGACAEIRVGVNTGRAFLPSRVFSSSCAGTGAVPVGTRGVDYHQFVDLNDDGRADHVWIPDDRGASWVAYSTGTSFGTPQALLPGQTNNMNIVDFLGVFYFDLDNDGALDRVIIGGATGALMNKGNRIGHRLETITNGFGRQVQIKYDTLANPNVYTADHDAVFPAQDVGGGAMSVVSETRTSDGIGGFRTRAYRYAGMKMHLHGIGNLGMRRTIELESAVPSAVIRDFSQDYQRRTHSMLAAGGELRGALVATNNYTNTYRSNVINSPGGKRYVVQIATTETTERDLNNAFLSRRLTENLMSDPWGNITRSRVSVFNEGNQVAARTVIDSEYENDADIWSIGLQTKTTVTRSLPSANPAMPSITNTSAQSWNVARRLVLTETQEPDNAALQMLREYDYDVFGNRTSATTSAANVTSSTTTTLYDPTGRFVKETTHPLGQVTKSSYDLKSGLVAEVTTPDKNVTTFEYDAFGRESVETRPDQTKARPSYGLCTPGVCPPRAVYYLRVDLDGAPVTYSYLDLLGREVRKESLSLQGNRVFEDRTFDTFGRTFSETDPYFDDETPQSTTFLYDGLDRVTRATNPDNTFTTITYEGSRVTFTNELMQSRTEVRNPLGQKVEILDAEQNSLTFRYDAYQRLVETKDPAGNVTTVEYDLLGRRKAISDPNLGRTTYDYDALGQTVSQTDAKDQITTFAYDQLGRLVTRLDDTGGPAQQAARWFYDPSVTGRGEVLRVAQKPCSEKVEDVQKCFDDLQQNGEYQEDYGYDALGRKNKVTITIAGERFEIGTTYDAFGRIDTTTYPAGAGTPLTLKTIYNGLGYTTQIVNAATETVYWNALETDARGNLTLHGLGNGLFTRRDHDSRTGFLTRITTSIPEVRTVQQLRVQFNALGNLRSRTDELQNTSESVTYDTLNRLKTVETTNRLGSATQVLDYDALGNIKSRTGVGSYSYGGTCNGQKAGPHAVTSVAGTTQTSYCYDKNGNMVQSGLRSVEYASFNKPTRFVQETTETVFDYNPDRVRYRRRDATPQGGQVTTLYVGGIFEKIVGPSGTEYRNLIGETAVYSEKVAADGAAQTSTHYFHRDHLDSVEAITDETGNVVERFSYDAWGKRRNSDWTPATDPALLTSGITLRGFTNQEQIETFGLVHMNGRVYDPTIGRFLSADPFVQDLSDLQAYNRYSYVRNNPLSATDPSGFFSLKKLVRKIGKAVKSVVRGAIRGVKSVLRGVAKTFAKVPGLQQVAGIAACIIPGGCLAFAAFSAAVSLSAGASLGDLLPGLALAFVGQAGPGGDLAGVSQGLTRVAETTSKVLNSDIGRFAQSPVGQGLIAEAQGKRFKDGFVAALPGAIINSTPLIIRELLSAPPTALYATEEDKELISNIKNVRTVLKTAADEGVFQPGQLNPRGTITAVGGIGSAAGTALGHFGNVLDVTQIGVGVATGDPGTTADGLVGLAGSLLGSGIEGPGLYLSLGYKVCKAEWEGFVAATDAIADAEYYRRLGTSSSQAIQTTRTPTQRRSVVSVDETRLLQNVGGRVYGNDEYNRAYNAASELEQIRMRTCCN